MQEQCAFDTCKTAELLSVVSSIPVSNWVVLKIILETWLHVAPRGEPGNMTFKRCLRVLVKDLGHMQPRREESGLLHNCLATAFQEQRFQGRHSVPHVNRKQTALCKHGLVCHRHSGTDDYNVQEVRGKAKQYPSAAQKPRKQAHTQMALILAVLKSHFQHKEGSLASLLSSNGKQVHSFTCEKVQKK